MNQEIVGCPNCATVIVGNNWTFCETCRRRGHTARMMTRAEVENSLSKPNVKNYPIAVQRRLELISIMDHFEAHP